MKINFGIDFGTTNSACIGIMDRRGAIKYTDGFDTPFPSLVIVDNVTGTVYRGREAWNRRQELGESAHIFTSIKNYLGTDTQWIIGGKTWTPEMVAAEVFKGLKEQVRERSGSVEIDEAVVAVPVGFSSRKRQSLRRSAELAGLSILSFVPESTAALYNSYNELSDFSKIAVFDWGGGTLDISILENTNGTIKELAVGGMHLGGDDIDNKLARWVHNQIEKEQERGFAFEQMPAHTRDLLVSRCEAAKRELSDLDLVSIRLNKYGDYGTIKVSLDIETFEALIATELEQSLDCMNRTLNQAKMDVANLGCVLLVGGSVNMRPFINLIERKWGCYKIYPSDSDWSVSYGAAQLSVDPGEYNMAEAIGVTVSDGSFYPIINQGDSVHETTKVTFAVVEDTQTANIVFANDDGRTLGYANVPVFGFYREQLDIKAYIDSNMIVRFELKSKSRSDTYKVLWSYASPRLIYRLPIPVSVEEDVRA